MLSPGNRRALQALGICKALGQLWMVAAILIKKHLVIAICKHLWPSTRPLAPTLQTRTESLHLSPKRQGCGSMEVGASNLETSHVLIAAGLADVGFRTHKGCDPDAMSTNHGT